MKTTCQFWFTPALTADLWLSGSVGWLLIQNPCDRAGAHTGQGEGVYRGPAHVAQPVAPHQGARERRQKHCSFGLSFTSSFPNSGLQAA